MSVAWMVVLLVVASCRKPVETGSYEPAFSKYDQDYDYTYADGDYAEEPVVELAASERSRKRQASSAPPAPPARADRRGPPPAEAPGTESLIEVDEPAGPVAGPRMVHYNGFARLRATRVDETLDAIAALAEQGEGRVERLTRSEVSIRVPALAFDEVWQQVLKLGDVLDRNVRADDITEQFLATDLRVRTLRLTRDKLIEALEGKLSDTEKLSLLHQLQRVTDQLDALEQQLRTLSDLAGFARISVSVVPRQAFVGSRGPELAGFAWIRSLAPFRRSPFDDERRIELPEPDGLVVLDKRGPFRAESADGVSLWTFRLPNDPTGDGPFWVQAIQDRIGDDFEEIRTVSVGEWSCLVLQPAAEEPYEWRVCVRPSGRHLQVAQVYYPGAVQIERYGAAIDAALVGGEP